MSVTLSDKKNQLIKNIAESQGFTNFETEVKAGSMKGDGYLGIINTVQIQENNKNKRLNLILKSAMTSDKLRESMPIRKAYEREIYLYQTIFPFFQRFYEEKGIKNKFTATAKCYATLSEDKEECLILENLREGGFKLWNRKVPMNSEHVALVFATYGKLHGTSLALKYLHPEIYEEFSTNMNDIFQDSEEADKKFLDSTKLIFPSGFRAVAGNEKATEAMTRFVEGFPNFFIKEMRKVDKYTCILHGDCWCNNMMFKYTDKNNPSKPTEVCLLDWQLSHLGSPILDLSYFFYASGSKEMFEDLPKFLKIYHENLSGTIKEAGCDPEEFFSYNELETQWKKMCKFGVFVTLFLVKILLGEAEDAPDLSELADLGKDIVHSFHSEQTVNAEIDKRISDVIVFATEHGYI